MKFKVRVVSFYRISLAVLFAFVGIIVFGSSSDPDHSLGWSFGIAMTSMMLTFVCGIVAFVQLRRSVDL